MYGPWNHSSRTSLPSRSTTKKRHVGARKPAGFIAVREHLAGVRIDARMRGHGGAAQATAEVVFAERFERARIELDRAAVFLGREQAARMEHRRGVGGASPGRAFDARIVRVRIAIEAVEAAACLPFVLQPARS